MSARRWLAGRSAERQGGPPSPRLWRAAFARIEREGWKDARRSRAAERDASGGGAPRAQKNAAACVVATLALMLTGGVSTVLACPHCFGAEETSLIDGTKLGILVLLGVTLTVQGGFVGFFLYLRKRAKRIADLELDDEWSELQRAGRSS